MRYKRLHPKAKPPERQHSTDAGYDLRAVSRERDTKDEHLYRYHTGISVEIPEGHVGLLFPRSSVYKTGLTLRNCVGVIDSGYRGEIIAMFRADKTTKTQQEDGTTLYKPCIKYGEGERCCQLVILPVLTPELEEVEGDLIKTDRGEGGFGSTGSE